jgi:hypothetical protein
MVRGRRQHNVVNRPEGAKENCHGNRDGQEGELARSRSKGSARTTREPEHVHGERAPDQRGRANWCGDHEDHALRDARAHVLEAGIGFEIEDAGNLVAEFVLDRTQVKALRRFLTYSLPRLKDPRRPSRLTTRVGKRTKTTLGRRWDGALLSPKQVKQWKSGQVVHPIVWCVA